MDLTALQLETNFARIRYRIVQPEIVGVKILAVFGAHAVEMQNAVIKDGIGAEWERQDPPKAARAARSAAAQSNVFLSLIALKNAPLMNRLFAFQSQ